MEHLCRMLFAIGLILVSHSHLSAASDSSFPVPSQTIVLWPRDAQSSGSQGEGTALPSHGDAVERITTVTKPTMMLYRATVTSGTTPAVLVCPGGGYSILAFDKEGVEIARWLNSVGVTAAILKYRVPQDRAGAFADVQRAMGLMRHHAREWNVDPDRIGIIGFSAGGHLSARLSTGFSERSYAEVDAADSESCRPDFTILIYPAYLADAEYNLAPELKVTPRTPPAFILQTQDDHKYIDSSIGYYLALKKAGVAAELHLFPTGRHGFGLRPSQHAVSKWPTLCETWMRQIGILKR